MKIKLNTKRYPFHKELVELAVPNGNKVFYKEADGRDRKSTRLNSSHSAKSRMPSSA